MMDSIESKLRQRRSRPSGKVVIGMAGGIGCGKSLVASQFKSLGCGVINADELSHEVLRLPGVRSQLVAWWGEEVLAQDGQISRAAVARHVFGNKAELERLEGLVHPLVHQRRAQARDTFNRQQDIAAVVEDCPLLFEVGLQAQCDCVVFVTASRQVQLDRVRGSRGWTETDLLAREKNQLPLDMKRDLSDYVIDNSGSQAQTLEQVKLVFSDVTLQYKSPMN